MKIMSGVAFVGIGSLLVAGICVAAGNGSPAGPPFWAYGVPPGPPPTPAAPAAPDTSTKHLPGNSLEFTRAQISNPFGPADWYPGDHPTMPDVVAHGKMPDVRACSLCHYPNGKGRAENAGVSGLPKAYFIQQLMDFRNGDRKSAEPRKGNTEVMAKIAKGMTPEEMNAAADYFGSMKWTPWIKVVESKTAPKFRVQNGLFLKLEGEDTEPLGQRVIEVPLNAEATEVLRDPHSSFIAYAPMGSLKKGEALAKAKQCAMCHGADLKGLGPIPGIAGRSPSYLMRQMFDMQQGARKGAWTGLMKPVVANLSEEDLMVLAAYAAAQTP